MLHIGCHLSSSSGYLNMGKTAMSIGADTFQFFTRNPRGSKTKPFDEADCKALVEFMTENNFAPIVAHAPYTLNPCSADEKVREFARLVFHGDMQILEHIPGALYNFHPGSHVGQGVEKGIELTAEIMNEVLQNDYKTTLLIECMSGKGSEIGHTFEQVRQLIDAVGGDSRVGVCIDTCHISDAGYDVIDNIESTMEHFDSVIGINRLKAVHINDSMNPVGAKKDRHQKIGDGFIGLDAFEKIVNCKYLKDLPFILETPCELEGYKKEIELLRKCSVDR